MAMADRPWATAVATTRPATSPPSEQNEEATTTETGQDMDKTRELLLRYQGKNGFDGACHVRGYEQSGQLPVEIAGALDASVK